MKLRIPPVNSKEFWIVSAIIFILIIIVIIYAVQIYNSLIAPLTNTAIKKKQANFPLKVGSVGAQVLTLQNMLNNYGAKLALDGKFGNKTLSQLKRIYGVSQVDSFESLTPIIEINGSINTPSTTGNGGTNF